MASYVAPFYGTIQSLSVDPQDNSVWVVTKHPRDRRIETVRIDAHKLMNKKQPNDAVESYACDGVAKGVLGHHTGLYIFDVDGVIYRKEGDGFSVVYRCESDFGLQGITNFRDGAAQNPPIELDKDGNVIPAGIVAQTNRQLLLVGKGSAQLVRVEEDGSFTVQAAFDSTNGISGQITAWAAETRYENGTQTHHCSFGMDSGIVRCYFTSAGEERFDRLCLMDKNEVELTAEETLHEGTVTALAYVSEIDRYGFTKRYIVTTGIDLKVYQISLLEGMAIPRKNPHGLTIRSFVTGALSAGDGAYRGEKFGRFYSLSDDGTIKAWLNEYTNEPLSSSAQNMPMHTGQIIILPVQHTSGIYKKDRFLGQNIPTPHLVIAGKKEIRCIPLVHTEKEHVEILDDLRRNGRMEGLSALNIEGGQAYVRQMGIQHESTKTRAESLERFKKWDAIWLIDMLRDMASNEDFPFDFRKNAMQALIGAQHPRRIVVLEEMLSRYGYSDKTQGMAFEALNILVEQGAFVSSLRPHRTVLNVGGQDNVLRVISDLAALARGNGPLKREARQLLQEQINHSQYDVALRVYDFLSGEGVEEGAVLEGVEGVLYGIYSNHTALRREMMRRLTERGQVAAFETTLILRRLLESSNETIRERALDVSLLRAPSLSNILRQEDKVMHERLYVLKNGPFAQIDDEEKQSILKEALPFSNLEEISKVKRLFLKEDGAVQHDIDILVELSSCTKDDIAVYALQAKASFGFESPAQGLLKLSNSRNEKVVRQAAIGLGYLVHLDDAHQRLCGLTLSSSTPFAIGTVSIYHAIRGYTIRKEDPVQNILRKVLDGGHAKLRKTAVVITQSRISSHLKTIRGMQDSLAAKIKDKEEYEKRDEKLAKLEQEATEAREMLDLGRKYENQKMIDVATGLLKDVQERKQDLMGDAIDMSSSMENLWIERDLLKTALSEETLHRDVRKEVYKTMHTHNLEDPKLSSDKTPTLMLLLNLRDAELFGQSLKDLIAHIDEVQDREWALALFKKLIDQDIVPSHHSNIWSIWSQVADHAKNKEYESQVLRIGFECSAPCRCQKHRDGSYTICTRHRIRRDAFLRVLSSSGDWLAEFIRDAIINKNNANSKFGESAAVLAVSERAKKAVANMSNPEQFILSLLSDTQNAKTQRVFASEILMMYPRYYNEEVKEKVFELRAEPSIVHMLGQVGRLMTKELYEVFMNKIQAGQTQFLFKTVTQFAIENNRAEEHAKQLTETEDVRLIRKALALASQNFDAWGKKMLYDVLGGDDEIGKIAFHELFNRLKREASRTGSSKDVQSFVLDFYQSNASIYRKLWVVDSLNMDDASEEWELEFLKDLCDAKAEELRERGFAKLNALQNKEPWVVELLKKGLTYPESAISDLCFQGLLAVHKLLGPQEEKEYLSSVARKNKRHREKAVALALSTTASWRAQFILEALDDEDSMIRSMMAEKLRSVSGLPDSFFQNLLDHKHEEVQELAREVLTSRGLFRPKSKGFSSLRKTLLEEPPPRPRGWWGWLSWYWKVQAWKDRKIKAVVDAGKTHEPEYYDVFRTLLTKFGYRTKRSDLWSHAIYATSWDTTDWWEFLVLHTGWVLQEKEHFAYAQKEAAKQNNNRMRAAWNIACSRAGKKENLKWLIQQYYDNGWSSHKRFIKREYLFEGLFSVGSTVGFDSNTEGPAFTIMQRLMTDDQSFINDIFRLNMLRLTQWGGPIDFIAVGYTSSDPKTVLESVQMRELQYDKDELFNGVVKLLNDADIPEKNPYELANLGGVWYDVVRLTLEIHMKTFDVDSSVAPGYWRNVASMISCQHPQLRARAVNAYFRRHVYGEEKERFQADIENFSRQLTKTKVDSFPLTQDGKRTNRAKAVDLAFDAYIGLIRKTDYTLEYRRDALKYMSEMCEVQQEAARVFPTLKAALVLDKPQIRFQAYQMMIVLQSKDTSLIDLDRLIQMGLRATDIRLKRMAVALIWSTDQRTQEEKIALLESILRYNSDVSAELAFELLYAFAGRPSAWDKADNAKEEAQKGALKTKEEGVASLQKQIDEQRNAFKEFETAKNQEINNIFDSKLREEARNAINERRSSMNEKTQALQEEIRAVNEQYVESIKESDAAHKTSMEAPLSDADAQSWSDAIARRDELLQMALDGYCISLRTRAVDEGLQELARRRPYFEKSKEEFSGYFERLYGVVRTALESPYSDLRRYTALEMSKKRFTAGFQIILDLLASHDASDQREAITALLRFGPIGLMKCVKEDGTSVPRTGLILLQRLADDEYGTIERRRIFNALGSLKDGHSSIVSALFSFLEKGPETADFPFVMRAVIDIAGTKNQILTSTKWADLTPSDYTKLQPYLSSELNWEHVSLDDFTSYYKDVYKESLLAEVIEFLRVRGWYKHILDYGLLAQTVYTKGFDMVFEGDTVREPIHDVLIRLALLPIGKQTQEIQKKALQVLLSRLNNRETWKPEAQGQVQKIVDALVEYLETNSAVITADLQRVAYVLASCHFGSASKAIFEVLYTAATGRVYPVGLRCSSMKGLGYLGDKRAVLALLNAAGLDAYGEELLVEPGQPGISASDMKRLQSAAAEGLGGMIFAQEREGIFQLLSSMSRSSDRNARRQGFEGLRYFGRSEEHVWAVASLFASRMQGALNNGNFSNLEQFLDLQLNLLEPVAGEQSENNRMLAIQPETEKEVRSYLLSTFFGESFERNGEEFNPLDVQESLFEIDNRHQLEKSYATIRQWFHGEGVIELEEGQEEIEQPIDFSYLKDKSPQERSELLKAEMKLFENYISTKYTNDVTKVLVEYLSVSELFDMLEYAEDSGFSGEERTKERYHVLYNALMNTSPAPVEEALNRFQRDYTLDLNAQLSAQHYTRFVLDFLEEVNHDVAGHMDIYVDVVSSLFEKLDTFCSERKFGDQLYSDQRIKFAFVVISLLHIARNLPSHAAIVEISKKMLSLIPLVEDLNHKPDDYASVLKSYLRFGAIDWDFVNGIVEQGPRNLRSKIVEHLTSENAKEVLPTILSWVSQDSATLIRLVDVLKSMHKDVRQTIIAELNASIDAEGKDPEEKRGLSTAVVLLLTKLNDVSAFQAAIDAFRDDDGKISEENALRSPITRRTTEESYAPPLVESLLKGLSLMASEKAEYYLRDLAEDELLDYTVRQAASKAADVAYRRRVPVHIRRLLRQ